MKKFIPFLIGATLIGGVAFAANNFAVNNATGTFTVIKSTDDGTGAQRIAVDLLTVQSSAAPGAAPTNSTLVGCIYNTTIPAPTAGQALAEQCDPAGSQFVNVQGRVASYRWASGPLGTFAASTSDVLAIGGSASKVVRITHISVCGTATAATAIDILVIKRSTADTGGTSTALTGVPVDSGLAAASGTVASYSVNPTLGTPVGNVDVKKINLGTTGGSAGCLFLDYGTRNAMPIVLRGTAEQLALNFNAVTAPTGLSLDVMVETTEGL